MTNIAAISAIQELRKFKGLEHAILAGGVVRDGIMGADFTDVDIIVPAQSEYHFTQLIKGLFGKTETPGKQKIISERDYMRGDYPYDPGIKFTGDGTGNIVLDYPSKITYDNKFGNFTEVEFKKEFTKDKYSTRRDGKPEWATPKMVGKLDCKYMGCLDVDIMGYEYGGFGMKDFNGKDVGSQEDFGWFCVDQFSYNIDKVWHDGETVYRSQDFEKDYANNTATLVTVQSIQTLPHHMKKFERLKAKYPYLTFETTALELRDNKKKEEPKPKSGLKPLQYVWGANDGGNIPIVNNPQDIMRWFNDQDIAPNRNLG